MTSPLQLTFQIMIAVLAISTVIGLIGMKLKPSTTWTNIWERVVGWWCICLVFSVALWLGKSATLVLFGIVSFQALREFLSIVPTAREDHRLLLWSFFVLVPIQYLLLGCEWYGLFSILIPVYGFSLLGARTVAAHANAELDGFTVRTAVIFWAQMICIYNISHIPALMNLTVNGKPGLPQMIYLILLTQLSDVFQYVFGKCFGRRKVAPKLSPNKTMAGLIGGVLTCMAISPLFQYLTGFVPWQSMLSALLITVLGFFGGLTMSAVKRDRGVKDWAAFIPGHGGVLDRFDSLIFSAPIYFHVLRYFFSH